MGLLAAGGWGPQAEAIGRKKYLPREGTLKEGTLLDLILQAVGNVGFPIAVAAYLLVRIESKLEALAASIARLAEAVAGRRQQEEG